MIERKIIKTRAEINEKEIKETIEKINKAKSWVSEKINKLDKPLTTVIKNKREKTQVNKIISGTEVTADNTEIEAITRDYYEHMPKKWTTWKK